MIGKIIKLERHGDDRGDLIAIESFSNVVDFEIKRVYYLFDTSSGVVRGLHAHKNLKQLLVCVSGSCKVCLDDGYNREVISLNKPDKGLIIKNDIWREMSEFSKGAVLLVLASEHYNEEDYIRNYDEFLKFIGKKQ